MKARKIIFIIGSGRTGTNWLANILQSHPAIRATIEDPMIFNRVTKMALNPAVRAKLFPELIRLYTYYYQESSPCHYVDKSHPNLWLAEALALVFPDSLFISLKRNPYATVSSMLKHEGVLKWQREWKRFPIPNEFLGIDHKIAADYSKMSMTEKCTLRWVAHMKKIDYLAKSNIKNRMLIISYERLVENTIEVLIKIKKFLDLSESFNVPVVNKETIYKWQQQLSESQCEEIKGIVGEYQPIFTE
ncbi:sulfotransferase [Iocasia frigidifontis]|uniref:Sulfotransferase n=1 Tax=Iocasia fonsfrigidae TaxID=2682810 RepID=A0A8A7KFV4_9FIRM|nr:sulfotransferase [Iocasia fonsfrigidae]QTL96752.1 sulfotransferase [Iocasia fonsfrigidae]